MPYRGCTPTFTLTVNNLSSLTLSEVWVTLKASDSGTELTKEMTDLTISGNTITVTLTQADTLAFESELISVQVRVLTTDGKAYATNTQSFYLQQILKDGQITV